MKSYLVTLIVCCALCFAAGCYSTQTQKKFVIDQVGILDSLQTEKLNRLYIDHERKTTNQIVLLTADSFYPDSTIEDYALHRFNQLGIGQKKINNGVLIVFSAKKRQVRIATGLGTEKVLTNTIAAKIIDSIMLPQFKQQKYFEGLWKGSIDIIHFLEKPENKIR